MAGRGVVGGRSIWAGSPRTSVLGGRSILAGKGLMARRTVLVGRSKLASRSGIVGRRVLDRRSVLDGWAILDGRCARMYQRRRGRCCLVGVRCTSTTAHIVDRMGVAFRRRVGACPATMASGRSIIDLGRAIGFLQAGAFERPCHRTV
jgi:hypothetical protein